MRTDNFSLDCEMNEMNTANQLEPHLTPGEGESYALTSLAVSVKRIADALERRTPGERMDAATISMVNSLADRFRQRGESLSLSEAYDLAEQFYKDRW